MTMRVLVTGASSLIGAGVARALAARGDEVVCLVEGEAVAEIAGQFHELKPYDTTFVPAGVPHCFRNRGRGPMRIYWTYASGHVTRTVVATGETADHLSPADRPATSRDC